MKTLQIAANGLTFAVDEAGEGTDVALCLHGFPECRFSWRQQLPALAAAGWHAVAPNLRGYGGSSTPSRQDAYRLEHLVADAAALFDALGARRRLLVAHDWGGIVAWAFAMRRTRPLDGLIILNAPHPAAFRRELRRSWRQRARSWYAGFFQLPWLPERLLTAGRAHAVVLLIRLGACYPVAFHEVVVVRYRANALRPGGMKAMLDYYRANRGYFAATGRGTPVIDAPTLLLWGERDAALGVELTRGLEPYVRDLTVERLPGVSHWVQQEAPVLTNAKMVAWLDSKREPARA